MENPQRVSQRTSNYSRPSILHIFELEYSLTPLFINYDIVTSYCGNMCLNKKLLKPIA